MTKNCIEFHHVAMERKKSLRTHSMLHKQFVWECLGVGGVSCVGQGGGRFTVSKCVSCKKQVGALNNFNKYHIVLDRWQGFHSVRVTCAMAMVLDPISVLYP